MTPRTRHHSTGSSGSTHTDTGGSTTDTSTRRPDGGSGGGTGKVDVNPDHLDSMASRLSNTGGRVDAVGTTLSGINVGSQSMGIVGGSFTGAAQTHVQTAREHVTRTREAVQNAQNGTKGTADSYRQRDADNASSLSSIDPSTDPPKPKGASGGSTTAPSNFTTPSGTSTPPSTGGGGSSTPTGGSTPPGSGGGHNGGGPGGPGGPPPPNPPSGPPPNSRGNTATPDELAPQYPRDRYDTATTSVDDQVKQIAQDKGYDADQHLPLTQTPTDRLSHDQRVEVADVRNEIRPQSGEIMTKVVKPDMAEAYLGNASTYDGKPFNSDELGGSVARGQDTAQYGTPSANRVKLGLDDGGAGWTPIKAGATEAYELRFPAPDDPTKMDPSFGSTNQVDADDMHAIAGNQTARNWNPPFLGTGYTDGGSSGSGTPEWMLNRQDYGDRVEMWIVREDGTESLAGVNLPGRGWFDTRPKP